jgi:uncharacterized RDD family membrane protein YckC
VQRVPATEAQGRIHTSACTVAILPELDEVEQVDINPAELRIDTYRSSGAGGQHVNKTDSAVRITHLPSGIVVECQDERSQHKNRSRAMALLKARLLAAEQEKQQSAQAHSRKLQVGSGDRSERIRTYNFPQGRVTDHRINLTLYKLQQVMDGQLDELIQALQQAPGRQPAGNVSEVAPGLAVDSVTGIDVSLPLAGAGARSYAFIVDWHIRLVLGLAWFVSGALLYNGRLSLNPPLTNEARWFGTVVAPALAIYFLYHYVLEVAMRGSTPGKRMAQVRLVTRDGGVPGIGPLLVRNVFRLVDSLPVFYGLGLTLVVLTRDNVRCGDMAAGTLLVYAQAAPSLALTTRRAAGSVGTLEAGAAELVAELLARWPTLMPAARAQLARQLLARHGAAAAELDGLDEQSLRARLEELAQPRRDAPA